MNGMPARLRSCCFATSSTWTPRVHALIGAPSLSMISKLTVFLLISLDHPPQRIVLVAEQHVLPDQAGRVTVRVQVMYVIPQRPRQGVDVLGGGGPVVTYRFPTDLAGIGSWGGGGGAQCGGKHRQRILSVASFDVFL